MTGKKRAEHGKKSDELLYLERHYHELKTKGDFIWSEIVRLQRDIKKIDGDMVVVSRLRDSLYREWVRREFLTTPGFAFNRTVCVVNPGSIEPYKVIPSFVSTNGMVAVFRITKRGKPFKRVEFVQYEQLVKDD